MPIQVANVYNKGHGREITLNLSDYIKSPNGEPLTYSLAFPKNYSFDSFKNGEYGWKVTGVKFDLDGDGVKEKIGWLSGKGDGLLVDTHKINGSAINGKALVGDQGGKDEWRRSHSYRQPRGCRYVVGMSGGSRLALGYSIRTPKTKVALAPAGKTPMRPITSPRPPGLIAEARVP